VVDDVAVGHLFGSPLPIIILFSYISTCRPLCNAVIEAWLNKPQEITLHLVDIWGQAVRYYARTHAYTHTNTPRVRAVSGCPLVKEGDLFSGH